MFTILIATYNGGKTLPAVLDAYRKLAGVSGGWKLVLINNGSDDDTKDIINEFSALLPISHLFETRRGKNIALNTGLSHIEGDLVVFTDDDVLPQSDWLKELRTAADSHPSYSIFGGPILPEWESQPEDWILSWVPLAPTFAILQDLDEGPLEKNMRVFGPNMAIRSSIFQMGFKFDETIGPNGSHYAQGSEAELLKRLGQAGFKAWHCKNAKVRHIIRSSQMNKKWVLGRAIRFGRGQYRLGRVGRQWKSHAWGMPVYLYLEILNKVCRLGIARLSRNDEKIFKEHWYLNVFLGMATEARNIYIERKN
jgi:glycosyltransferase involved in cell wall biosynthesis